MGSSRPDSRQNNPRKRKKRSVSPYRGSDSYDDYILDLNHDDTVENTGMIASDEIVINHLKKLTSKSKIDRNTDSVSTDFILRILVSRSEAVLFQQEGVCDMGIASFSSVTLTVSIVDESNDAFLIVRSSNLESAARLTVYVAFVSAAKFNNFGRDQFTLRLTHYHLTVLVSTKRGTMLPAQSSTGSLHLSWPDPYNRNPHLYRVILSGDLSSLFHALCRLLTQSDLLYESDALIKRTRLFGLRPDLTLDVDLESRLGLVRESQNALLSFISTH